MLEFFDWSYENGGQMAKSLDYVPMPKSVSDVMERAWASEIRCSGAPVWK